MGQKLISFIVCIVTAAVFFVISFSGKYIDCWKQPDGAISYNRHDTNSLLKSDSIGRSARIDEQVKRLYCNSKTKRTRSNGKTSTKTYYILSSRQGSTFSSDVIDTFDSSNACSKCANAIMLYKNSSETENLRITLSNGSLLCKIVAFAVLILGFFLLLSKNVKNLNDMSPEERAEIKRRKREFQEKFAQKFNK